MNRRIKMWSFSISLALLLLSAATVPVASADPLSENPDDTHQFEEKALQVVSERNTIPIERLEIRHSTEAQYPLTGEKMYSFKMRDTQSGKYYSISLDENLNAVDLDRSAETDHAEDTNQYEKFSSDLNKKLRTADPDENISVWIWMTEPENMPEIERDASDEREKELRASRMERYLSHEKPVIDLLGAAGIEITYASILSPSIFADLPPDMILELSTRPDVVSIALSGSGEVERNTEEPPVNTPDVQSQEWCSNTTSKFDVDDHAAWPAGLHALLNRIKTLQTGFSPPENLSATPSLPLETPPSPTPTPIDDRGVRVFTDHESYYIGGIVTFGIENNGHKNIEFLDGAPAGVQIKQNGTWISFRAYGVNMGPTENIWYVHPGETKTFMWDTSKGCRIADKKMTKPPPGQYRIVFRGGFASDEFTLMERPEGEPAMYNISTFSDGSHLEIVTDETSYSAGDVVTFQVINNGAEESRFPSYTRLKIRMKKNGSWAPAEILPCTNYHILAKGWSLQPGETKTYWWDTGGTKCESRLKKENMTAPPGIYRIVLRFGTYKGPIEFVSGEFTIQEEIRGGA